VGFPGVTNLPEAQKLFIDINWQELAFGWSEYMGMVPCASRRICHNLLWVLDIGFFLIGGGWTKEQA
jgi:hypothetical protein